ncbi:hypothetical protein M0R45_002571 [Rubus argutus]|uniref:DUF7865 domain-containing protein n=1 Tax=Rubus argutus TaxID=59490 RepID=A0AAW1VRQ7_RUBAR
MSSSSSSAFFVICLLHSVIAITCGAFMMFYMTEVYTFGHGIETAQKLLGSTPHDQLLIRTSDSFSGLLLFAIGFFTADGVVREGSRVPELLRQGVHAPPCFHGTLETVGDVVLALSWVFFLVYSWREKYD